VLNYLFYAVITIPVVVAMVSEEADALDHLTGNCASKYPVVVTKTAKNLHHLLKEAKL